jgi:CubicO group peptidase (beta-lactamase class C family)
VGLDARQFTGENAVNQVYRYGIAIAALLVVLMPAAMGAAADKRLEGDALIPSPVFDAGDGVAGRSGSILFGNPPATFRSIPEVLPSRRVAPADKPSLLKEPTKPFEVHYTYGGASYALADFVGRTDTTGLLILKGDQVLFEGYFLGADRQDNFISFSTGKSFVSTLLALAIRDGKIASVEDPVVKYLPEVKGSAYGVARIRDLLQMSSGTSYSEEYEDADSDIQQYVSLLNRSQGGIYDFARSFKSARPPGQKFYYASTDTEVLGALIARATGKSLSAYMSEKLWKPIGAGAPARWVIDQPGSAGREMAAGGLLVQLRDFGRFGLLFANGGKVQGKQILPEGWVEQATRPGSPQVDYGKLQPDYALGYGYQWWCLPGPHRSFTAQGIHGQFVLVDPVEHVVVVKLSNWEHAWEDPKEAETYAFFSAVVAALR